MSDRPDIDADVAFLRQRPADPWDMGQLLSSLIGGRDRRTVLSHFAAAALHAAVKGDIAELRSRGVPVVPLCTARGSTVEIVSTDRLRKVHFSHTLEKTQVDICYYRIDRGRDDLCLTLRMPVRGTTDYAQLPGQVRQRADEIRLFLIRGQLPDAPPEDDEHEQGSPLSAFKGHPACPHCGQRMPG